MKTERLFRNMIDQILEAQLKLGYAKETVRLFYPVDTLYELLELEPGEADDEEERTRSLLQILREDPTLQETGLGEISFHARAGRVEVRVPPEGSEYVHREIPVPAFLEELLTLFREHHNCTGAQIREVFAKYSDSYRCEKMPEGTDFDYVLYFPEGDVDPYYYCIHEEMGHTIYHRFLKEDYRRL